MLLQKCYNSYIFISELLDIFIVTFTKYDVQKNYMWILGDLKKLFRGKLSIQITLVTLNYWAIAIPTVIFLGFSKREMIGLDVIFIIMFSYYFILLRTLMAINIFTNLWHNDYITFVLGWLTVNVFGLLISLIEEILKIGNVVSSHTVQGQMVGLVPNTIDNGGFSRDIIINIFFVMIGILICEYVYKNNREKS